MALAFSSPCKWLRKPMIDVAFLSLVLNLGISDMGLAFRLFRSKTSSLGRSASGRLGQLGHRLLVALDKLHLHAEFARRLLDLGQEEQIFDEAEDARGRILANRDCGLRLVGLRIVSVVAVARDLDRRRRASAMLPFTMR